MISQDEISAAVANELLAERGRQIGVEEWTPEHDDAYRDFELSRAAGCYAFFPIQYFRQNGAGPGVTFPMVGWPFGTDWWKPGSVRRALVKAGALIIAEIERMDRAAAHKG